MLSLRTYLVGFALFLNFEAADFQELLSLPTSSSPFQNPCKSNPCQNGICSVDFENSTRNYHCYCEDGYTGVNCETDWNECWSDPCLNGGICIDQVADYNCTCPAGYRGKVCEINIDECLSDPCLNNGTCVDDVNGYFCECINGFQGLNCENDVSICNTTAARKCANGGHCIDGLGEKHFCYCPSGWEGEDCQENVNECTSDPCLNGGMCMDSPGSYICSCQFGFTGSDCEIELEPCSTNPCLNEALCFMLDPETTQCYCVPDFHGPRCEFKYNDCVLPPLPKCFNGGRCLDGVDDFTCSCPGDFMGRHCECPLDDPENCVNVNESVSWSLDPSLLTTEVYIETTSSLNADSFVVSSKIADDSTENSGFKKITDIYDGAFPTSIMVYNVSVTDSGDVNVSPVTSLYIYEQSSSELITRSFLADDEYVIQTTPVYIETKQTISPTSTLEEMIITNTLTTEDLSETTTSFFPADETTYDSITEKPVSIEEQRLTTERDATITTLGTTIYYVVSSKESVEKPITTISPLASSYSTTTINEVIDEEILSTSSLSNQNEVDEVTSTSASSEKEPTLVYTDETSTHTQESETTTIQTTLTALKESDEEVHEITSRTMLTSVTEENVKDTYNVSENSTTIYFIDNIFSSTPISSLLSGEDNISTDITIDEPQINKNTEEEFYEPNNGTSNSFNDLICTKNVCNNGGTCLSTLDGVKCICPLQYHGAQCEDEVFIQTPGFVGHSGLVYAMPRESILKNNRFSIQLSFRTSQEDGLILFTGKNVGHLLVSGYIKSGILTFKISCGHQIILFSDPRHRVDTGYLQRVSVNITIGDSICSTIIQLNETHTMSGEQQIDTVPRIPDMLYLGLVPHRKDLGNGIINTGFQGCMKHLELNDNDLNLYRDAVNGRDIVECESAICAIQPCRNGAICTQHDDSGSWFCDCPPGFTGALCERPVCQTNPCQFGGTCLGSKTGSGFLCLCQVGRRGALCEQEVELTQPSFRSSVGGYSSYLAFPVYPENVLQSLEWQFHFSTSNTDQVALLFFIGQRGLHDFGSDFLAMSYIKGHILMTWDLGAGPRRIFTKRPVDERYLVHAVRFGRNGRRGWLQVDNFPNITGLAPGKRDFLNITSQYYYIGGHENFNFSLLPHDFPVHRGFSGCMFDMAYRSYVTGQLTPLTLPSKTGSSSIRGRNVDQCYHDICASSPCSNGGTCIGYGASFLCECTDGRYGITCVEDTSACTTGMHKCSPGSKCTVTLEGSYACICPFEKTGKYCDEDLTISDPLFTGHGSYMHTILKSAIRFNTHIHLEIKPESLDGHLVHLGQSRNGRHQDFLSLLLVNRSVVFTFSLGGPVGGNVGNTVTIKTCCVEKGKWYAIEAGRYGRNGYLRLDGQFVTGSTETGLNTLDVDQVLYLGGIPNTHLLFVDFVSQHYYEGCIRNLHVNERSYPLTSRGKWIGWNILDCDGTACGGELCKNGGKCSLSVESDRLHRNKGYTCECPKSYLGDHCEVHEACIDACQNGGSCVLGENETVDCDCPLGFHGQFCEREKAVVIPRFLGNGFISYVLSETKSIRHLTSLAISFKTKESHGMILWLGQDQTSDDYLGIGLKGGMLHLVWNLGWFSRTEMTIPSDVNDDKWHKVVVERVRQDLKLDMDGKIFQSRVTGSYHELNTANMVLIGGSEEKDNVQDMTRGHFSKGFIGCIVNVTIQDSSMDDAIAQKSHGIRGRNVEYCIE